MVYILNKSPIGLNSLETRMKVLSPNCHNFHKLSSIRSLCNSTYFKKPFLNKFDSCLEYKSVSYTTVFTPGLITKYILTLKTNQAGFVTTVSQRWDFTVWQLSKSAHLL